ncbi:MAG: histidine phosphatase family protein [Anaerolineales bacterium]
MTELVLVRHGETDWNIQGRFQGQSDPPLNERGLAQARTLALELAGEEVAAVYTSDLQRARQTAEILAEALGAPLRADLRLREIHQGVWEGMVMDDIRRRYPEEFAQRAADPLASTPPGGESVRRVQQRALGVVSEISARHPDEEVVVVSHGLVLALIRIHFLGLSPSALWEAVPANARPDRIRVPAGGN